MLQIGVLVSGGGTNLQAIMDAIDEGTIPNCQIAVVISNKRQAYALERAALAGIAVKVMLRQDYSTSVSFDLALAAELESNGVGLVLLAGFTTILGPRFFDNLKNRVMNVHPALIPSFSGSGYYGIKVHQAVLDHGCKITGASVHFVTPEVDAGPIILQKAVAVKSGDTPEILQQRVMEEAEWIIYPEAVRLFALDQLHVEDHQVVQIPKKVSEQPLFRELSGDSHKKK